MLITTPLGLRYQDEPRWKVIQNIEKTNPFLPEEFQPEHPSFKTIQNDSKKLMLAIKENLKIPAYVEIGIQW
jgi:hypothetical protein